MTANRDEIHTRYQRVLDWRANLEPDFYGKGPRAINVTYVRPSEVAPGD